MFAIGFIPGDPSFKLSRPSRESLGFIQIGDFRERFLVSLTHWSRERYVREWEEGIQRLLAGDRSSALIQSITDPKRSHHIFWWPIYRRGDSYVFHNQMLILGDLPTPFDPHNPYASIPPYRQTADNGTPVSEWRLPIAALQDYRITR